jgi:hypothetical protein
MASKEVSVREWKCDGCGTTARSDTISQDSPAAWTIATTTIKIAPGGDRSKGLDLCPHCSKDPRAAAQRYKASIGQ